MRDLGPELMARYDADQDLDVIEVALEGRHEWFRTSPPVVLPHALDAVTATGACERHATCRW